MVWSGLGCLGLCINSIVWKGNTNDWAPVWCDICEFEKVFYWDIEAINRIFLVTRVLVIGNFGVSAAMLCSNRRIYLIASVRKVTISRAERRRQVVVDLAISLGFPIVLLILRKNLVFINNWVTPQIYFRICLSRCAISHSWRHWMPQLHISNLGWGHPQPNSLSCT